MPYSHSETTYQGPMQQLQSSCCGMVIGLVIFGAAFPLLAWNEGAVITTTRSLDEGLKVVVPVDSGYINAGNNGKLIHFIADIDRMETLGDSDFGVAVQGAKMNRQVEMYQWVESKHSRTVNDNMGGKRTQTDYYYNKEWKSRPVNSDHFKNRAYQNPSNWPVTSKAWNARNMKAGAFTLSPGLMNKLSASDKVPLDYRSLVEMDKLLGSPSHKMIGGNKHKKNQSIRKLKKKQKKRANPHLEWGAEEVGAWVASQGSDYVEYQDVFVGRGVTGKELGGESTRVNAATTTQRN